MKNITALVTHGGIFHADEVMATAILKQLYPDAKVIRVNRVLELNPETTIVYDIGGGKFDHHQKGGNGVRENGIPFASAGLVWQEFGHLIESDSSIRDKIDKNLIQAIDAQDNGVSLFESETPIPTLSSIISGFNPTWDSDETLHTAFQKAVEFAEGVLLRALEAERSKAKAKDIVITSVAQATDRIVVLPQFVPWQEHLFGMEGTDELLFIVFPSLRGGFSVQAIPEEPGSFNTRLPFPQEWRGLSPENLRRVTGVADATFVHPAGFIGGAESLEGAIALARAAQKSA